MLNYAFVYSSVSSKSLLCYFNVISVCTVTIIQKIFQITTLRFASQQKLMYLFIKMYIL